MQVFHTAGVPPSRGRTILANSGWIKNKRTELTNSVIAKKAGKGKPPWDRDRRSRTDARTVLHSYLRFLHGSESKEAKSAICAPTCLHPGVPQVKTAFQTSHAEAASGHEAPQRIARAMY